MLADRTTLTQYLIEERRRYPGASGELNALIANEPASAGAEQTDGPTIDQA